MQHSVLAHATHARHRMNCNIRLAIKSSCIKPRYSSTHVQCRSVPTVYCSTSAMQQLAQKGANARASRPTCSRRARSALRPRAALEVAQMAADSGSLTLAVGGGAAIAGLGALLVATDPQKRCGDPCASPSPASSTLHALRCTRSWACGRPANGRHITYMYSQCVFRMLRDVGQGSGHAAFSNPIALHAPLSSRRSPTMQAICPDGRDWRQRARGGQELLQHGGVRPLEEDLWRDG
jgi:hypothetical protein